MNYGEVLQRAWQIIWKHKILWIFGILAGCGETASNTGSSSNSGWRQQGGQLPGEWNLWLQQFQRFIENIPFWVWLMLIALGLILFVVIILLNTIGRIGLIQGTVQADDGAPRLEFGSLFSSSFTYFWRVFLLNLLVGLALVALFLILLIPTIFLGIATLGIALLCLIPLLCLLIPFSWFVSLVLEQSIIAIVAENRGIISGLERGWQVVTRNIGPMIVMALILFVGGAIVGLILGIPAALTLIPIILGAVTGTTQNLTTGGIVSAVLFCLYLPVLLAGTGILRSYISSAWTLTFRRLTGILPAAPARIDIPVEPLAP